jgi:hypothetical protein
MMKFKIPLSLLFPFLIILIAISCSGIKLGSGLSSKGFLKNDSLKNLIWRDIYLNDGINLYKLSNAKITADSIKGEITLVTDSGKIEKQVLSKKEKGKYSRKIVLYTKSPIHVYASNDGVLPDYSDNKISIGRKEVLNAKTLDSDYIALIVVGGILLLLLIAALGLIFIASSFASGSSGSSGCYIATMVYGSYDAPEVMVLRRFRDNVLSKYTVGKIFINVYYKYSPIFVEKFRHSQRVNKCIKVILDRLVKSLS